jgi:hypothetical protein
MIRRFGQEDRNWMAGMRLEIVQQITHEPEEWFTSGFIEFWTTVTIHLPDHILPAA